MSYKSSLGERYRQMLISKLAQDGERIMRECVAEKEYKNRSGALVSSYGWAVYYHGRVKRCGFSEDVQRWQKKYGGVYISGSQLVTDLLTEGGFKYPSSSESMGLVIIAAVPYGQFLEEGKTFGGGKYKVISMSYDKLKQLSAKYGKASIRTILHGQLQ